MARARYNYRGGWGEGGYSRASSYKYTVPSTDKIKKYLKKKQALFNKQGKSIRVMYGPISVSRKSYGLAKMSCENKSDLTKIVDFLDKTKAIGQMVLGPKDEAMMKMIYGYGWNSKIEVGGVAIGDHVLRDIETYKKYWDAITEPELNKGDPTKNRWGKGPKRSEPIDQGMVQKIKEKILNRLTFQETLKVKEESIRRGQRINRAFITGMSYKPLINSYENKIEKKKALCILDGSGSMNRVIENAATFMHGLRETGLLECRSLCSMTNELCTMEDSAVYHGTGGGEGFDVLEHRLDSMGIKPSSFDYVFVFSDLCIGNSEMSGLQEMIGGTKNIIFNFSKRDESFMKEYPELKIKDVKSVQSMIDTLIHYI